MSLIGLFKITYWLGMVVQIIVRAPYRKMTKDAAKIEQRLSTSERVLPGLLTLGMGLLPLIYSLTDWLSFADYRLPVWLGWFGVFVLFCSLYVYTRSHIDLKAGWSPTLEIYQNHVLITDGIYRYIRHPMYASEWLWAVAQILLLQNWLAGPAGLLCFIPFYFLRVPAEEKMMLEAFGDRYRDYMQTTGRVFPRLRE